MFARAASLLSPKKPFGKAPEDLGSCYVVPPSEPQMVLRMLVKRPETGWLVPEELKWLEPTMFRCEDIQYHYGIRTQFIYITVRSGPVVSVTDDLWHVDGFSMRVPHPPEQNYIWSNCHGTEWLDQEFVLPSDFDPMRHNIHHYFQDRARPENIRVLEPHVLYGIDPYVVHRRPQVPAGLFRTFFRISFIPIEIEDDTCTVNPYLPREKPYGRKDLRERLARY